MANPAYIIRPATIDDVPALAALHVATFNETHGRGPGSPTYDLRAFQWKNAFEARDDSWFCLVIEKADGGLIGFAKGQPYHQDDHAEYKGELNKIYLLRSFQKLGWGRQLICKVAEEFIRRGISSMLLFGDAHNPSNQFYEHMGAQKLYAKNGAFHGGYGWPDLQRLISFCA